MSELHIYMPTGAMGAYPGEDYITSMMRRIAVAYSPDFEGEWAEKYGTEVDTEVFMMKPMN